MTFSVSLWTFHRCIIDVRERCTESLSNLYVVTCRDVCQQIWRKQKSFSCAKCCMICYTAVVASESGNFCRQRTDSIVQHLKCTRKNEDRGWGVVGAGKFSNVRGERALLQQKADAGRFTLHCITGWLGYHLHTTWGALYADRSNRTEEEEEEVVDVGWVGGVMEGG